MQARYLSQPSLSSSTFQYPKNYWYQRQVILLSYLIAITTDIISTYFGIEHFGFIEQIPWTKFLIDNYGWGAIVLREIAFGLILILIFRYYPNSTFKLFRWIAWTILIVYFTFTTVNNCILMLVN